MLGDAGHMLGLMTTIAAELGAPTVEQARRAAQCLAAAGVAKVMVYGALLEGGADCDTPIELVAVVDDLGDYAHRQSLQHTWCRQASEAAGHMVELHLVDWPEWRLRSRRVVTSLEAHVAATGRCLHTRAPRGVNWTKEIGLPSTSAEEANRMLSLLAAALNSLLHQYNFRLVLAHPALAEMDTQNRLARIASSSHRCAEIALKCLGHLSEIGFVALSHDLDALLAVIDSERRDRATQWLEPLRGPDGKFVNWRVAETYGYDLEEFKDEYGLLSDAYVDAHMAASLLLARFAAQEAHAQIGPSAHERCEQILELARLLEPSPDA